MARDLIEDVATRVHDGCTQCAGTGTVTRPTDDGPDTTRECPELQWARRTARAHAAAIVAAGWRIARYEQVRPTWVERDERIAQEWKP